MKGLPTELIYLLIFGGILLFNFVAQQAARRRRAEGRQEEEVQEVPQDEPLHDEPIPDFWGRSPEPPQEVWPVPATPVRPVTQTELPIASSARRVSRFSKRSLLGSRRDMQNAIVIAMILGPCRALEPPGTSPGGAAIGTPPGRAAQ
jgi:hypothetical protein